MKKCKVLAATICLMLVFACLGACKPENYGDAVSEQGNESQIIQIPFEYDKLADAQITKICADYAKANNAKAENVNIKMYFGTYIGEAIALFIEIDGASYDTALYDYTVADCKFEFPDSRKLYIYHNSEFVSLDEFYKKHILTDEDIIPAF